MKTMKIAAVLILALAATAAATDMLSPGTYTQHGEGGDHAATSLMGGLIVIFDGRLFFWTGDSYTNGPCRLEFVEILDGQYGWSLVCPHRVVFGIVTGA